MYTKLKVEKLMIERTVVRFRELDQVVHDKLSDDLQSVIDSSYDIVVSGLADYYNIELVRLINKHAPVVEKSITKRNRPKWLTEVSLELKKKVRRGDTDVLEKEMIRRCLEV